MSDLNDGTKGPIGPHQHYRPYDRVDTQRANLNESYRISGLDLSQALALVGHQPLSDIPLKDLSAFHWALTTMSGLLEAELVRRDGTSDFAAEAQVGG